MPPLVEASRDASSLLLEHKMFPQNTLNDPK